MRTGLAAIVSATLWLSACGSNGAGSADFAGEPKLATEQATLDAALRCTPFTHPELPPVLLVHGTFTSGFEQYDWTYLPLLANRGFDVCTVSYPDRGLGDMQVSAEYVVNALRRMHADSGRKVAMIGHSQGVSVPRWAIKWWPSARAAVEDFVMEAGPNHGTTMVTSFPSLVPQLTGGVVGLPEVFFQFAPDSKFTAALNADDETPGDISYTALYSNFYDELVQPTAPIPTAALDFGQNNPKVANILLQDVCPGRFVDHLTIGLTDRLAFELALDAITHPGPADVERVRAAAGGQTELCGALPIVPSQIIAPQVVTGLIDAMRQEGLDSVPALHLAAEEPPLKPYAR